MVETRDQMRVALILVGVGVLALMEIGTPPRAPKHADGSPAQPTLTFVGSGDTLMAADRLEIPHTQQASAQQIFSAEPMAPPVQSPVAVAPKSPVVAEAPARAAPVTKPAVVLPKPRPRQVASKTTAKPAHPKPIIEAKSCQPGALDGLFKALSLPLGCQT